MAIPNVYDNNGFAGYLKNEILQHVSESLMWEWQAGADPVPPPPTPAQALEVNGDTVDNRAYIDVQPIPTDMPLGTQISFTDHLTIYIPQQNYEVGETRIYVFPYVHGVIDDETVGTYVPVPPPVTLLTHPIYQAITDETLLQLGYSHISQVTGTEKIHQLRLMGRIEAWRFVMANTMGDIFYEAEGAFFHREQVFQWAKDQREIAETEYGRIFGSSVRSPQPFFTSATASTRAVW